MASLEKCFGNEEGVNSLSVDERPSMEELCQQGLVFPNGDGTYRPCKYEDKEEYLEESTKDNVNKIL